MPKQLELSLLSIEKDLKQMYPTLPNTRWIALRLLEGDEHIINALENNEFEQLFNSLNQTPLNLQNEVNKMNEAEF